MVVQGSGCWQGSNSRPQAEKACALPTELQQQTALLTCTEKLYLTCMHVLQLRLDLVQLTF